MVIRKKSGEILFLGKKRILRKGWKLKVIQDTREQTPYQFSEDVQVQVRKLDEGDYSIPGFEKEISIERKTINDYTSSISHGRGRFEREMERLQQHKIKIIMVDGISFESLINGRYRSRMRVSSVLGTYCSYMLKFGIQTVFCRFKWQAEQIVEEIFYLFLKHVIDDYKRDPENKSKKMRYAKVFFRALDCGEFDKKKIFVEVRK